jgi:urease accessory protein
MLDRSRLTLAQFADGLFPIHSTRSLALETRVRHGRLRDLAGLDAFVREHLEANVAPVEAVAVSLAARMAAVDDVETAVRLDTELDAACPIDAHEPSRRMGRTTLRTAMTFMESPTLAAFMRHVERAETPCHHAVAFGLVGGELGWSPVRAVRAFLEASAAAQVSAARRLLALTESEGETLLWSLDDCVSRLAAEAAEKDLGDLSIAAPRFEMAALRLSARDARRFAR